MLLPLNSISRNPFYSPAQERRPKLVFVSLEALIPFLRRHILVFMGQHSHILVFMGQLSCGFAVLFLSLMPAIARGLGC